MRPTLLAKELAAYDAVNVGTAGTFIIRKPGNRAKMLQALRGKLPLEAAIAFCDSRDLIRLQMDNPFGDTKPHPDQVQFVSILARPGRRNVTLPAVLPEEGEWFVRILGARSRLLFGIYRRHMKTIAYLSRIDDLFGASATTRSWKTILAILRVLRSN